MSDLFNNFSKLGISLIGGLNILSSFNFLICMTIFLIQERHGDMSFSFFWKKSHYNKASFLLMFIGIFLFILAFVLSLVIPFVSRMFTSRKRNHHSSKSHYDEFNVSSLTRDKCDAASAEKFARLKNEEVSKETIRNELEKISRRSIDEAHINLSEEFFRNKSAGDMTFLIFLKEQLKEADKEISKEVGNKEKVLWWERRKMYLMILLRECA